MAFAVTDRVPSFRFEFLAQRVDRVARAPATRRTSSILPKSGWTPGTAYPGLGGRSVAGGRSGAPRSNALLSYLIVAIASNTVASLLGT